MYLRKCLSLISVFFSHFCAALLELSCRFFSTILGLFGNRCLSDLLERCLSVGCHFANFFLGAGCPLHITHEIRPWICPWCDSDTAWRITKKIYLFQILHYENHLYPFAWIFYQLFPLRLGSHSFFFFSFSFFKYILNLIFGL